MKTKKYFFYLFIVLLMIENGKGDNANTCDTKHLNETKQVREKEFVEDSFYLNVTADSKYSSKFEVIFEVCEKLETTPQCTFTWRKPSNNITIVHWNPGNETICSARYHDVNSSLDMFEFHISQLVRRYLSFLKLSITASNEEPKTLSLLCLDVLYQPKVTSLTVDDNEVIGDYLINEGQEITVTCFFDKGRPAANFYLLNKNGKELKRADKDKNISLTLAVLCEDDWPIIRCEGERSEYNRSVAILVRCPLQFVDNSTQIINMLSIDDITFRVKAHTIVINSCLLTSVSLDDRAIKKVNCTLKGKPPDLELTIHLRNVTNIVEGNWMLLLENEKGLAKTTLRVTSTAFLQFHHLFFAISTPACAKTSTVLHFVLPSFLCSVTFVVRSCAVWSIRQLGLWTSSRATLKATESEEDSVNRVYSVYI